MGHIGYARRAAPASAILALSLGLSGCVAAIPLIAYGGMAVEGFMAYKTVQLAGGGSVAIEFPTKDGKTVPPQPIAPVKRIAVWPGDEGDVHFAERLQTSGRFVSVAAPAAVSPILADAKTPTDLRQLTEQEQGTAFDNVCRKARVDFVFASRDLGVSTDANMFSFSRANATGRSDLLGYSCAQHQIVWRDQITLIVNAGSSTSASSEVSRALGDAWAERVFVAMGPKPGAAT